jgi:hypothetical protein
MLTNEVRSSFGTQRAPSPAAAVTFRKSRRRLCDSYGVPTVVVNTRPCSCHSSPAFDRSPAWRRSCACRRRPHYYTRESPMQQWLNLLPMAGALLNLAAAMTNLAATIMNRRSTTVDRAGNGNAR